MIYEIWGLFTIHKCSEAYFKQPNLLCPGADCTPLLKFIILHFLILSAMLKCVLLPSYYNLVLKSTMTSVLGPVRLWWPLFFFWFGPLCIFLLRKHTKLYCFRLLTFCCFEFLMKLVIEFLYKESSFCFFFPKRNTPAGDASDIIQWAKCITSNSFHMCTYVIGKGWVFVINP